MYVDVVKNDCLSSTRPKTRFEALNSSLRPSYTLSREKVYEAVDKGKLNVRRALCVMYNLRYNSLTQMWHSSVICFEDHAAPIRG